jgi:hypothetical protein
MANALSIAASVYREYSLASYDGYEIDHLIAIQLGGSNNVRNLWPQNFADAERKDALENILHSLVCTGELSLREAQDALAHNWIAAYRRYVRGK